MPTPIITVAPTAVQLAELAEISNDTVEYPIGISPGPWTIGGATYICLAYYPSGNTGNPQKIGMYKNTGSGYVRVGGFSSLKPLGWIPYYPGSGTTIFVVGSDGSGSNFQALQQFDTGTDTWGSQSVSGGVNLLLDIISDQLIVPGDGTQWLWYSTATGIWYQKFSGGAWGAKTHVDVIGSVSDLNFLGSCIQGSGAFLVVYSLIDVSSNNVISAVLTDSSGVVGSPAVIYTQTSAQSGIIPASLGYWPIISGTSYFFSFSRQDKVTGKYQEIALVGVGLASPVWTTYIVDNGTTVVDANHWIIGGVMTTDKNGHVLNFWSVQSLNGILHDPVFQIWYSQWDGVSSWGAPVLFYDVQVTPLALDLAGNGNYQTTGTWINPQAADGTWTWCVTTNVAYNPPFSQNNELTFAQSFTPPASPLTLSCPVGAGAATIGELYGPFDLNSTTTGGTSPYTFSLASGMLPPGVTLSPSGIITGVPTVSGVFEYSPRVIDSSSPVQSATTSAPCGVGVGAALSPCAGVIPQPSTDVQFELRRVYCTMKPAPRIPVRGS